MRTWFWSLALSATLIACQGRRQPPIEGGEGIVVTTDGFERVVAIDSERVPIVDGCQAGEALTRAESGWRCASVPAADQEARIRALETGVADRIEALATQADQLDRQLATLLTEQQALMNDVSAASQALAEQRAEAEIAPTSYGVISCVRAPSTSAITGLERVDARVRHAGDATGLIELYCPVIPSNASVRWNRLTLLHMDPDGNANDARVSATLHTFDASGRLDTLATADSNQGEGSGTPEVSATFEHTFDFSTRYYFVRVHIERSSAALAPEARGVRLSR